MPEGIVRTQEPVEARKHGTKQAQTAEERHHGAGLFGGRPERIREALPLVASPTALVGDACRTRRLDVIQRRQRAA